MKNNYIACYWTRPNNEPNFAREKHFQDFKKRYPFVTILQKESDKKFCDYELINEYLQSNKGRVSALVVMDTDIIVENSTLRQLESSEDADYIHPFTSFYDILPNNEIDSYGPGMGVNTEGHSGYIHYYSAALLKSIDYTFPTAFIHGGFDYFICKIFLQGKDLLFARDYLRTNSEAYKELEIFYDKTKAFHKKGKVIKSSVIHEYHERDRPRLTDFSIY